MHAHCYDHRMKVFSDLLEEKGYGNIFLLDKLDAGIVRTGTLTYCLTEFFKIYDSCGKVDASLQLETQLAYNGQPGKIHCIFRGRFEECYGLIVREVQLRNLANGNGFIIRVEEHNAIPNAATVKLMFCTPE